MQVPRGIPIGVPHWVMLLSDPQAGGGAGAHPRFRGAGTPHWSKHPVRKQAPHGRGPGWQGSQGTVQTLRGSWAKRCWGPAQASVGLAPANREPLQKASRSMPRVGHPSSRQVPHAEGQPRHWARDTRLPSPPTRASHMMATPSLSPRLPHPCPRPSYRTLLLGLETQSGRTCPRRARVCHRPRRAHPHLRNVPRVLRP